VDHPDTVHASVSFSFKGETHLIEATLDLSHHLGAGEAGPNFHLLLAQAGDIDPYSYLYEVLESSDINFSRATGAAADCCEDGAFRWDRYLAQSRLGRDLSVVGALALKHLGVTDLAARADLRAALLAAYRAGQADRPGPD
jgi:hypothetical protein